MSRYLTPAGVVEARPVVQKSTGQQFIRDSQGRLWRLSDCTILSSTDQQHGKASEVSPPADPPPRNPGKTSLSWDDPRLAHRHRLKGSGIPWAKPLSDGIPSWRWDGYWCEEDREDGGSHA